MGKFESFIGLDMVKTNRIGIYFSFRGEIDFKN